MLMRKVETLEMGMAVSQGAIQSLEHKLKQQAWVDQQRMKTVSSPPASRRQK